MAERKVVVCKDGPYLVSGALPLEKEIIECDEGGDPVTLRKSEKFPTNEGCALCRCGNSGSKPFCDGSHAKTGFVGTETASREKYLVQAERITGPGIDLTDAQALCAGTRFCHRGGGTWELTGKSADPKAKALALDEACKCLSGRLVAWDKKTGKQIEVKREPSISVIEDPQAGVSGPLFVKGGVQVESADGKKYEARNRITLCRCGQSGNKPFCDGSHIRSGFNDGDKSLKGKS